MNNVARALLLIGALVLALLIGVLIGRGHRAQPFAGNEQAVQINTTPPPMAPVPTPAPTPLPAPVIAQPKAAPPAPAVAPDQQVQEDAAAVGMTTREAQDQAAPKPAAPAVDSGNAQ
jgi:hypothetical protein